MTRLLSHVQEQDPMLPGSVSKLVCPKDDLMIPRYYLLSVTEKLAYG